MKKLMRMFLLASLAITAGSVWGITLDNFDYANQAALDAAYPISYYDPAGGYTTQIFLSTADKAEGSAALELTLSYPTARIWHTVSVTKTFATPVDLSNAKRFSIWIKGDPNLENTGGDAKCIWLTSFFGSNGAEMRYVDWDGSDITTNNWHKASWTMANIDMEENPWGHYYLPPNMDAVASLQLTIEINENEADTTSVYFDDYEYYNTSSLVNDVVFDDFEGYATTSALQAAWSTAPGTAPDTVTVQLSTAQKHAGSNAMNANLFINDYWMNTHFYKEFATPINASDYHFIKFWFKGDATSVPNQTDEWNAFYIYLSDTAGSWINHKLNDSINDTTWNCYYVELADQKYDFSSWSDIIGPFVEEYWDPAGSTSTTDVSVINRLGFTYQLNRASNPTAPLTFSVYFDDITFVQNTSNDLSANVSVINAAPSSAAIPITVSGGAAPYTWSLSTAALGTLSATSGTSVTFTPGAVQIQGTLTITDADDQTVVIPVNITPTWAPLAKDWALME